MWYARWCQVQGRQKQQLRVVGTWLEVVETGMWNDLSNGAWSEYVHGLGEQNDM